MAEDEPSFEVRERRRFKDAGTTEPGAESAAEPDSGRESGGTKAPDAEANDASAAAGRAGQTDEMQTPPVDEPGGSARDEHDVVEGQTETGEDSGMPDLSVFGVLQFTTGTLTQLAWQGMGLIANSSTGKVEPRLSEARMAIDALGALIPVISPTLDEVTRRELQTLLSNLRLNYVEQVKRHGS